MEPYGAGWADEPDPPPPGRPRRLSGTRIKWSAVVLTVALLAGGGFWISRRGSDNGPKVGDCAIDKTTDVLTPAIKKAACTDPAAVYEVAAKTTALGSCPAGDYLKLAALGGGYNPYNPDKGTGLCLALHVRQGECLHIHTELLTPGDGTLTPRVIDCGPGRGADRFRITMVRTDTSDAKVCPADSVPFSYSTPRSVICAGLLSS